MSDIQNVFDYEGKQIRTIGEKFVAKDVCEALEISNVSQAVSKLDEDEKGICLTDTLGGEQELLCVTESGLYTLVLGSRKAEAKQFKRWITHEVIPSIRKHGAYMTPQTIEEALLNPDTIIKLATDLKNERTMRLQLQAANEQMKPLANFASQIQVSKNTILIRELAKIACKNGVLIGEKRLYGKLREWGLIFKGSTEPKQEYVERGYFEVSEGSRESNSGTFTYKTTRVTGKGQVYIINRLLEERSEPA